MRSRAEGDEPVPRVEMRRRRDELGLTQEAASEALGIAPALWSSWESGVRVPLARHHPRIARLLRVSLTEVLAWFEGPPAPAGPAAPPWPRDLAFLEAAASELWSFQAAIVPELLQTAGYATAVERGGFPPRSPAEVDRRVAHRLARQDVLTREDDAPALSAVVDETVLQRVAGGREVMAGQLHHLVTMARRPNIELRILPLRSSIVAASSGGAFLVLRSPGASAPYLVCTFDYVSLNYHDRVRDLGAHIQLFEHLVRSALSPDESIDLIQSAVEERYA